jgi:hypothetical protein
MMLNRKENPIKIKKSRKSSTFERYSVKNALERYIIARLMIEKKSLPKIFIRFRKTIIQSERTIINPAIYITESIIGNGILLM